MVFSGNVLKAPEAWISSKSVSPPRLHPGRQGGEAGMHGWLGTYRLWEQCRPDRQTQGRSRGVLIREKEPGVPSAPDTGLAALHQTFSIPYMYTLTHSRRLKH